MNNRFGVIAKFCLVLSALLLGAQAAGAQDTMRVTKKNLPEVLKKMEETTKPGTKAGEYAVVTEARASGKTLSGELYHRGTRV